jgi:hypothetical protein
MPAITLQYGFCPICRTEQRVAKRNGQALLVRHLATTGAPTRCSGTYTPPAHGTVVARDIETVSTPFAL